MDLSIIIVNYNVKHFLEQCLHSVRRALHNIQGEVIIIDNNSVDGSPAMIREKFPAITLIENHENRGFSKANNQGIRVARGRYVLLLNPDTIVQEDSFAKCLEFMNAHPDAGAMGVKMIDGQGRFLPESKRALPTPSVAFYKMFGLSKLFPGSVRFNRYHLGHLDPDRVHEVDVLPGAFICIRKEVLDSIGGLDEDYFMYGEDVDLSFRIKTLGYKNYYVPETTIIHFKGESTRKGSLNYVALFYRAMATFARKHLKKSGGRLFSVAILMAIYLRAFLSGLKRIFRIIFLPLADLVGLFFGYQALIHLWGYYKFSPQGGYPEVFTQIQAPLYVLTWFAGILVFSGYRRPYHFSRAFRGIIAASIFLLLVYALLPLHLRFSRALILMGSLWALLVTATWRFLFLLVGGHAVPIYRKNRKRILIVAGSEEFRRIEDLVKLPGMTPRITGRVDPTGNGTGQDQLGTMQQLPELIHFYHIDEIIFSADDILMEEIIWQITRLADHNVQFKIAPPESMAVIGSSSKYRSGDLYFQAAHPVTSAGNRRTKRLLDILTSLLLILASPLYIIAMKHPKGFYRNAFQILKGRATWVGPRNLPRVSATSDPYLKPPVLSPAEVNPTTPNHPDLVRKVEMNYIQNYRYQTDLRIIMHSFSRLGQNPAGN